MYTAFFKLVVYNLNILFINKNIDKFIRAAFHQSRHITRKSGVNFQVLGTIEFLRNFPQNRYLTNEPIEIDQCIHFLSDKSKHMAFRHFDWLETN